MTERKSKSPYQRYGKSPHRYSELFNQWFAATKAGDTSRARKIGQRHTEAFGGKPMIDELASRHNRVISNRILGGVEL